MCIWETSSVGFLNEAEVLGLCRSRTNDASVDVSW